MHHALFLSISRNSTFVLFDNAYYFPLFNIVLLVVSVPWCPNNVKKAWRFSWNQSWAFSRAAGHFKFLEEFFLALSNSIDHLLLSWHFHHAKINEWTGPIMVRVIIMHVTTTPFLYWRIDTVYQYNFSDNIDRHLMMTTYIFLFSQGCFLLKT